jgi:putative transposase
MDSFEQTVGQEALVDGREAAAARLAGLLSPQAIDSLIADAQDSGMGLDGAGGLLQQMMKAVLERALAVEMSDHLGYEAGDPAGRGSGNNRSDWIAGGSQST